MKSDIKYRSKVRFIWESVEGLILLVLIFFSWPISRRWLGNWGATTLECSKIWPGDKLTPSPIKTFTRAIDVDASSKIVWSWVVQLGLGRAGFYSYELFECLVGIPVKNVESILPEYQSIELGTKIKLHPNAPGIPVGVLSEGRYLCFGHLGTQKGIVSEPRRSWSIYIEPMGEKSCRLLLRSSMEETHRLTLRNKMALILTEPIDFLMEQRMLRTIRRLSER